MMKTTTTSPSFMSLVSFLFFSLLQISCAEYTISDTSKFMDFMYDVNRGTSFSGTTVLLDADIDFSEHSEEYMIVGAISFKPFLGTFNGQGYTISNYVLNSPGKSTGLFGATTGATIQNLVMDDSCSVNNTFSSGSEFAIAGGIIAQCFSNVGPCIVENCVNMASISFTGKVSRDLCIGGIIGDLESKNYKSSVKNCVNYGTLTHFGSCNNAELGGIVGLSYGISDFSVEIRNCLNYGTLTHNGTSTVPALGGIVSISYYTFIDNCVNIGTMSTNIDSKYVGAIAAGIEMYTEITHCYWSANSSSSIGSNSIVGTIDSAALLSENSAFDPTTFDFSKAVTIGSTQKISLVEALNAAAEHYYLYGYSHWLLNKGGHDILITVDDTELGFNLTSQIVLLPRPVRGENDVLYGWYMNDDYATLLTNYVTEHDLELYGKFETDTNKYTITFETRGGSDVSPITEQYGAVVDLPDTATKDGCAFFRWEAAYGSFVSNEFIVPARNVTLYAVWLCTHIATPEELVSFSRTVNNGADFSGTTVFLDADIDFAGGYSEQFIPIGVSADNYFNGTFDGQGHTISNLEIETLSQYAGLFGYSGGATIQNVVVDESCSFVNLFSSALENAFAGGIVGVCKSENDLCTIENSVSMARVSFAGVTATSFFIGGIVGSLNSRNYQTTVRNCVNYGTITHSGSCGNWTEVGGIAGTSNGTLTLYINIQNSLNYGTIRHDGTSAYLALGGIVGASYYSSLDNCVSSGSLIINQENENIGFVVGKASHYTKINHCYWTSDVGGFNVYGVNDTDVTVTDADLVSLDQTLLSQLNEYAETKGSAWSKWFMLHLNGGSINNTTQKSLVEIQGHFPDPTKEENSFLSWFKDADCNKVFDSKKDSVSGITGLYAAWTPNKYVVTFDFDNGTTVNVTFSYNTSIEYPKNLMRDGYTFNGWNNKPELMPAGDITITALWKEAVVTMCVEIVFSSKDLVGEEDAVKIIREYTEETFVIEKFERNAATGETTVIIRFVDEKKAVDFVRVVYENMYQNSSIKSAGLVYSKISFYPRMAISLSTLFFSLV